MTPFVITTSWDDGHPLDKRIADMLLRYELPGTFYVPMKSEYGVLQEHEIRELSTSFEIGAHTLHHVYLDSVALPTARQEIVDSKKAIEDICGTECKTFCFPGGKYSSHHLDFVEQAGFKTARTVELLSLHAPHRRRNLVIIPTTLQAYQHSRLTYARNVLKRFRLRSVPALCFALTSSGLLVAARTLLDRAATTGGIFHLWGHSWEIEALGQWAMLEDLLALMASYKSSAQLLANGAVVSYAS